MLSQCCRKCKANNAEYLTSMSVSLQKNRHYFRRYVHLFVLTFCQHVGILGTTTLVHTQEIASMSDEKRGRLRQSHTLHPHPERVRDSLFTSGSPFFDPCDLVQVKYELLRRVRVDGYAVSEATALFALSRPTFYAAQAAWERAGISGLLPEPTGPRHAYKLLDEIVTELQPLAKTMSSTQLAAWLWEHHGLSVHPRSIERALARPAKKGGSS